MTLSAYAKKVMFHDGRELILEKNSIVVLVGANNCGKTTALKSIFYTMQINMMPMNAAQPPNFNRIPAINNPIVDNVELFIQATSDEVDEFLQKNTVLINGNFTFPGMHGSTATLLKGSTHFPASSNFGMLGSLLSSMSATIDRVHHADSRPSIDFGRVAYTHPLHHLHQAKVLRDKLSASFKKAFGTEIGLDVMAGNTVPLHVGNGAALQPGENIGDEAYIARLRTFPRLETQGDGMRSYVGTILSSALLDQRILFIDEPETFLHPPQIRQMARSLGAVANANKQIFIATHSPDFLRGLLESNHDSIVIVRLNRNGDTTTTSELRGDRLKAAWSDPSLRYSNGLDGVFYDRTIVCEADGDCKFYGALSDALRENDDTAFVREALFVQTGGKGGIPKIVRALNSLAVPVVAVADFDIFRQTGQFKAVLDALNAPYEAFKDDLQSVRDAVERIGANRIPDAKQKVIDIMNSVPDDAETFSAGIKKQVNSALKPSQGWDLAKNSGLSLFNGKDRVAAERLLNELAKIGLYVVPSGELESFVPQETEDKDRWVRKVLEDYGDKLSNEPALGPARIFVSNFMKR